MSIQTIGLVELSSIARGMETADAMLKASQIELLEARPICPGKYMVLVCGDASQVQNSVDVGKAVGGHTVVDEFLLPSVHPSVIAAISGASSVSVVGALGIIECFFQIIYGFIFFHLTQSEFFLFSSYNFFF